MANEDSGGSARAYIGLGSNLGDRVQNLAEALNRMAKKPGIRVSALSSIYEGAAHTRSPDEQAPDFLNAVAAVLTSLRPGELLGALREIERRMGRDPLTAGSWQPRTIDLDLLVYENVRLNTGSLTLPHPRLGERRFVLEPLAEIDDQVFVPPPFGQSVRRLLDECTDTSELTRIGRFEHAGEAIYAKLF